KALEELRDKIATMPQDQISTQLKEQLAQAQTIKKDSGVVAIENALESLQHRYATNELDKAIAAAPTINDKYATLVLSIVEQSQAVSNNPQASTQEIASQLTKQLLNNAKGNALNTLAGLNNLNNAQASALANVIAQAQDANQVAQDLKQAQDLDKAMATLKGTYTKVDEAYKVGTNLPYEAFFIPADKLKFAKDTIAKVGKVTPEAGQVYLDNLPAQIEQLNSDLNTALDLLGQGKGQANAMEEEFTKLNTKANTLENNLQVNANKLYNSPKAIQNQIKDLQTKIKDLSDKYFDNHAAYMGEGNAKMKQLVEQLSNLNDQVAQFSPQVFMNNNSRITQAQNLINNNSEYTSDIVAKDNLTKFNNATTFAQADKLLNEQVALNNKVKENVQQIVANLTN
ncbi:GA module-containing protein, partial [Mycoplasma sp. AA7A]|uniref:GA module-containing protein n=1 Tax=Mycoplasma sp. AA7A TaxID=3401665 RepID=UPI003AAF43B0